MNGFHKGHSTSMSLIEITDKRRDALDKGEYLLGLYLDLSKAFDTVDHNILLTKLDHYGTTGIVHTWFKIIYHIGNSML